MFKLNNSVNGSIYTEDGTKIMDVKDARIEYYENEQKFVLILNNEDSEAELFLNNLNWGDTQILR